MPRFKKAPVEISAWPVEDVLGRIRAIERGEAQSFPADVFWLMKAIGEGTIYATRSAEHPLAIKTLEGVMTAHVDDMVIQGIRGEFYPCAKDIFDETYIAV